MTPDQVAVLAVELRGIREDVAELAQRTAQGIEQLDGRCERIEAHVQRTNGRVNELEVQRRIDVAVRDDRDTAKQDTSRRRAWVAPSVTAVACVVLGAGLERLVG